MISPQRCTERAWSPGPGIRYPALGEDRPDANQPTPGSPTSRRVTVQEATGALGVTVEAVRGRIKRGKLEAEREKDGSVYVWLDADRITTGHDQPTTGSQPDADRPAEFRVVSSYMDRALLPAREVVSADRFSA